MSDNTQTFLCIDYSGSTGNNSNYWNSAKQLINSHPKSKIIFWDTSAKLTTYQDALKMANIMKGHGGTQPQCFASMVPDKCNLIIVTDGQIYQGDVQKCDTILNSKEFSNVEVYFMNTGGSMKLSVSAPFTRKTNFKIFVDGKKLSEGSSLNPIDLTPYSNAPQKFIDESENILTQIVMQNLGKNNQPLRNELLDLQKNLIKTVALENAKSNKFAEVRKLLQGNQLELAMSKIKDVLVATDSSLGKKIEAIITEMVRQCSGSSDFSFNILQPGRLMRAKETDVVKTEELPQVEDYNGGFECPICFDSDLPCLLIKAGDPIFKDVEKSYMEALLTNPLLCLLNKELMDKLKRRLDHVVGFEAAKILFSRGGVVSPITRDPISCIITPVGDKKDHIRSTNYALADLFFGRKLVGQPELWLLVLYYAIQEVTFLKENEEFIKGFEKCIIKRMETNQTNITLTGLPIEPLIKCPVDIAIWYCVVSPFIVNNTTNEDDARNRLRSFGSTALYLTKTLDLLKYPYDKKWTLHRISLYRAFCWMMDEEKNNTQWRKLVRAQYQNSLTLTDSTIVLLDGPASTNKPALPNFPELNLQDITGLSLLVDRTKTNGTVMIPLKFKPCEVPAPIKNYGYNYDRIESMESREVPICPETMRPYVIDRKQRKHWKKCSEKLYGPLSKQLSTCNYFNRFVSEHNRYPQREEFIKHLSSKQANKENPVDTLPKLIMIFVDDVFSDFEKVLGKNFTKMPPSEFKRRVNLSMPEVNRLKMDKSDL